MPGAGSAMRALQAGGRIRPLKEVSGTCRGLSGTTWHVPDTDQDRAGVSLAMTRVARVQAMIASVQNARTNGSGMRMKLPITP
jgi:hypothetical protein